MNAETPSSPLEDVEFLARSEHRVAALSALARRPQSRADLLAITDVSQSTIGRTLRDFEDRNWIRREGKYYDATQLGAFVAAGFRDLVDRVEVEGRLRDVWRLLPGEDSGFTIDMCADATVTVADSDDPYRPLSRFKSLLDETERLRFAGFDVAMLELCRDDLCRRIVEGMETEVIDPPNVVEHIRSTYPEQFSDALASGNLTIWLHDDLPEYGVGIFDDRIAISGYDPDSGTVKVLIDTDAADAREWAESVYESYRRETPTVPVGQSARDDAPRGGT